MFQVTPIPKSALFKSGIISHLLFLIMLKNYHFFKKKKLYPPIEKI